MSVDDMADDLLRLADSLVAAASPGEQVEVVLSRATSTTVKVYGQEVESLTSADSSGAGIRVVRDGRLGFAALRVTGSLGAGRHVDRGP
ncbi:MAG: DNA gyrase modulator [Microthrixaceae bacterium]